MAKRKHKGQDELESYGFDKVESKWQGVWFVAQKGTEEVCFMRQGSGTWHAFFTYGATGSGNNPVEALKEGLGSVIETDMDLMNYCHKVRNAPTELVNRFEGLYLAGVAVVN